jgi:hypothetical protein
MFLLLAAVVSLGVAVGCSSGPPQDLLGPGSEVGQAYRTEYKMTLVNGTITVKDGDVSQSGRFDLTAEAIDEEEILAVEGTRVTKSRIHVVRDQTTQTVHDGGKSESRTDKSPLEGETIELEQRGDDWKRTLVGKEPNDKQTKELRVFPPPKSDVDYYPADRVKPGHCWNVDVKKLQRLWGSGIELESGTCARKFEKTIKWDSELCAQIQEELDVRGRMRDEDSQGVQLQLKCTGPIQRSLPRGFSVASNMTGTMTVSGTMREEGKQLQTTITGPVTIEWRTHRK